MFAVGVAVAAAEVLVLLVFVVVVAVVVAAAVATTSLAVAAVIASAVMLDEGSAMEMGLLCRLARERPLVMSRRILRESPERSHRQICVSCPMEPNLYAV